MLGIRFSYSCIPLLIGSILTSLSAFGAGGESGGGGKGVLCDGTLRTLDLYEAVEIHHLSLSPPLATLDSNLRNFGPQLQAYFETRSLDPHDPKVVDSFMREAKQLMDQIVDIPSGEKLPVTDDATLPALPSNCQVVQIIVYTDSGTVYRDLDYWNLLDLQNQAALVLHEAVYHGARSVGARTSDETRRLIGLDFADQLPEAILKPTWEAPKRLVCGGGFSGNSVSPVVEIFAIDEVENGKNGTGLYFPLFKGELKAGRVRAFLPGISLDQFSSRSYQEVTGTANDPLFGRSWNVMISQGCTSDCLPDTAIRAFNIRVWEQGQETSQSSFGYCFFK